MKCVVQGGWLRKIFAGVGLTAALLAPTHLKAQYDYDPRSMALLPPYCKYTQNYRDHVPGGNDLPKIVRWYEIMGGSYPGTGPFHAMHHYCRGLQHVNYATFSARTREERQHRHVNAVVEYDYVLDRSATDFALRPEILTKKGESLIALGKAPLAIGELQRAIQLKPDYWPPYTVLSDYYKGAGNPKMAREVLEQGLSSSPDATALKRRLAELDGVKARPAAASEPAGKKAGEAVK